MGIFDNPQIFLLSVAIIFCVIWSRRKRTTVAPTNWPVVGMLPGILQNFHRIHSYATEILAEYGGTFELKGPCFCNLDMLVTCDPANIHHIFSRNFPNYPKGPEFNKIFEILGDGIFNADFDLWEVHRRITRSFLTNNSHFFERAVWDKIDTGLFPVLEFFSSQGISFDLQDVFQRFTFDSICKIVLNYDPKSLCVDLPYIPCAKALDDTTEALMRRHVLPEAVWKMQKWLGIGRERRLSKAWESFDEFIYRCLTLSPSEENGLLTEFREVYKERNGGSSSKEAMQKFLRDTALNLMLAGRDTTSTCLTWLFWLVAGNPSALMKIRDELNVKLGDTWRRFGVQDSHRLVYLHGALCESLRLFPPVALEHKEPIRRDVLPSNHHIRPNAKVIVSFFSTGRMENVWGKDCLEFKPERWITARGGIKHEPSYKFPAFNAGPRTCLGKETAFVQMKMVAAAVIFHYDIELEERHTISVRDSIILQAKHGLKVRLSTRKKMKNLG